MIITQTPFRMSFFGGGTDFPSFYNEYGGAVISTTFNKYCIVSTGHLPRFFDYKNRITYSRIEKTITVDEIVHPLIKNAMKYLDMEEIRLDYEADLPARTGLGTSSSFAVGMLNAFYALKGKFVDKKKLAEDAIYLERVLCNESGGVQDQIAAAFGGLNRIDFSSSGFSVSPIIIFPEKKKLLNENLMLFFTGFTRYSHAVQQVAGRSFKEKIPELVEMKKLVDEAEKILTNKHSDLNDFGRLLDYTWKIKRGISTAISTDAIDEIYQKAIKKGAIGGKLLGAGGGGFLLFYVEKDKQDKVKEALKNLLYVPFDFEDEGSRVLYYRAEYYEKNKKQEEVI